MKRRNRLPKGKILSGKVAQYEIADRFGKGGRGETYLATVRAITDAKEAENRGLSGEIKVIIKTVAIEEERGPQDVRRYVELIDPRLVKETVALSRLRRLPVAAQYFDNGLWETELSDGFPLSPRFLVEEFIEGERLDVHLANRFGGRKAGVFRGLPDATAWFDLARKLAEALMRVHQRGVIHTDIWPQNIMIRDGDVVYIDFGESVFRDAIYRLGTDEGDRSDTYLPPEWHPRSLPSRRGDIYSLGGVLYFMACGADPPQPYDDLEDTKRRVQSDLDERNPALSQENPGIADIIARCLRRSRDRRIQSAEALIREIAIFSRQPMGAKLPETLVALRVVSRKIQRVPLFSRVADVALRRALRMAEDMDHGMMDLSGDHEELVASFTEFLSTLQEGDEYLAISVPQFWTAENMGINGRFLSMNQLCASRGVKIQRLFLLTSEDRRKRTHRTILERHCDFTQRLASTGFELRCRRVTTGERKQLVEDGKHRGLLISGNVVISCAPIYGADGVVRYIRVRLADGAPSHWRRKFEQEWSKGEPLTLAEPGWYWRG